MSDQPELKMLSDEFAEYSGKIVALHEKKKELVAEFRKVYEEHKEAVKLIEQEACDLTNQFEAWKRGEETQDE